jgi:putative transposase
VPQSLAKILIHLIYSTKDRYPFLRADVARELHSYTAAVLKNLDCFAIQIGSADDHVHVLFQLSKKHALAHVIEKTKTHTSRWIKGKGGIYQKLYWQRGYGAFSVSPSDLDQIKNYISNQREHHKRRSFQEELIEFLRKHDVLFDERYLWD